MEALASGSSKASMDSHKALSTCSYLEGYLGSHGESVKSGGSGGSKKGRDVDLRWRIRWINIYKW